MALLLAIPAFAPWMDPRLDLFQVHDARIHMVRLYHMGWLVERGVLYPRWVPDMFMGYGYPLLNFYGPAFYALGLGVQWLARADVWDTYRYAGLLIALTGTAGAFTLTLAVWGGVLPALAAALSLAYGPYVFQVNLWVRGALPEALALALIPWLLLACHRLFMAERGGARLRWGGALVVTGTAPWLSHNLTAVATFAVAGVWLAAHALGLRAVRRMTPVAIAVAFSLGLASFFWLPALAESGLVQLETFQTMSNLDWHGWLVEPSGLTDKDQQPENRQSRTGLIDRNLHYPHQLIATPKISLGQAGLGLLTLGVIAASGVSRPPRGRVALIGALWIVALTCWFLTLSASRPLWETIPGLPTFQHPWRFLGPGSIALAVAAGGALTLLWDAIEQRLGLGRAIIVGTATVTLVAGGVLFNSLGARRPPLADHPKRQIDAQFIVADERQDFIAAGTTGVREFLPREVQVAEYTHGTPRHVNVFEWLYPDLDWLGGLLRPLAGELRFLSWRAVPLRISARVANESGTAALLGIRQLRFAGWRAWLDGARTDILVPDYLPEQQTSPGFMVVRVPPGEHTVDLAFGPSGAREVALSITLLTAAAGAGLIVWLTRSSARGLAGMSLLITVTGAIGVTLIGYACWRAARPVLGRFAALPVPAPQTVGAGAWAAQDLAGSHGGGLVVNVAEAARAGRALVSSPTGSVLGPDRYVDVRFLTVADVDVLRGAAGTSTREWLYLHPPSSVAVDVVLPARRQLWFQTALALDPTVWTAPVGDGVRFRATVAPVTPAGAATGAAASVLVDRSLNPRANAEDRKFVPVAVDLSPWAGQTVRVTLSTDPRDDLSFDWAGWAQPVISVVDSARDPLPRPPGR